MTLSSNIGIASPKLFATLVGLVGATFAVVIALVLLVPLSAFGLIDFEGAIAVIIGTAIWIFSVAYMYGLLRHCKKSKDQLLAMLESGNFAVPGIDRDIESAHIKSGPISPVGEQEVEELGDDFVRIQGTNKIVRLTDGVTRELLSKLAAANLPAISQRALDAAGVATRDPSVEVNAKVLVTWLAKNEFIRLLGNSRYEITPLGEALMKTVGGTSSKSPPTTTRRSK